MKPSMGEYQFPSSEHEDKSQDEGLFIQLGISQMA